MSSSVERKSNPEIKRENSTKQIPNNSNNQLEKKIEDFEYQAQYHPSELNNFNEHIINLHQDRDAHLHQNTEISNHSTFLLFIIISLLIN